MIARFVIDGGRHDGADFERSRYPSPFLWIDGALRCWVRPGSGRELHRLAGTSRPKNSPPMYRYQHAHLEQIECAGCGWLTPRGTAACVLCGVALS